MISFNLRKLYIKLNQRFFGTLARIRHIQGLDIKNIHLFLNSLRNKARFYMGDFCETEKKYNKDFQICLSLLYADLKDYKNKERFCEKLECPEFFQFDFKGRNRDTCVSRFLTMNYLIKDCMDFSSRDLVEELVHNVYKSYKEVLRNFLENLN